jgi:hypothetical protein
MQAIAASPIQDAVVRLIYRLRPDQVDAIDTAVLHQALAIAHSYTMQPHLIWAELDANATSPATRALIIRPAVSLEEGGHYIVALRNMKNSGGIGIPGLACGVAVEVRLAGVPVGLTVGAAGVLPAAGRTEQQQGHEQCKARRNAGAPDQTGIIRSHGFSPPREGPWSPRLRSRRRRG